eukprot:CAMPEP_0172664750 /NCGR_PEP_ID=MMETSP1074-20121228/6813_1 /TAXON_ID=2916 /ORGANISM="Ceratium fusus, Strain PA161109" /LENGTH=46 /DNA_ID= /DNA_START= /DNA_END= /DNA_ORIENTATION=
MPEDVVILCKKVVDGSATPWCLHLQDFVQPDALMQKSRKRKQRQKA